MHEQKFPDDMLFVAEGLETMWPPDCHVIDQFPTLKANRMGAVKVRISGKLHRNGQVIPWSFDFILDPPGVDLRVQEAVYADPAPRANEAMNRFLQSVKEATDAYQRFSDLADR